MKRIAGKKELINLENITAFIIRDKLLRLC